MIKSLEPVPLTPSEQRFLSLAAELATSLSFNATLAQIYALLFIRHRPLSLGEITALLGMSKGNISVNIRVLESWGTVRKAWVLGSRQDHYEPVRDLRAIAVRRLQEGFSRRLAMAQERLAALQGEFDNGKRSKKTSEEQFFVEKLEDLKKEMAATGRMVSRFRSLYKLHGMIG